MTVFFLLLLLIVVPTLEKQMLKLLNRIPEFLHWLQGGVKPYLSHHLGFDFQQIEFDKIKQALSQNWRDIGNVATKILSQITQSGQTLLMIASSTILIPVVTFYLLRDWDLLVERIHELIPREYEARVTQIAQECDQVLGEFLHGQLLLMFAQGVIYTVGLWIVGLEAALLIGLLAGLVSFVPYLGIVIGVAVAGVTAFMQFQDIIHVIYILIVFGVGQVTEGMLLQPLLVGDRIGLHPVAVIFAVMAGGNLFGFVGVLLALPVAAIIVVLLRHAHEHYINSDFYTP